ncbi:ABC transporter substrate-binding protein [Ruminococcaceae bacterium OttesenSCG-928-D13]|nr:ABC transporter substrate-binding protein [Ruminococcaceae bacterium OttesenSCG-928-D13]
MNFFKRTCTLLLAALLVFSLAACNSGTSSTPDQSQAGDTQGDTPDNATASNDKVLVVAVDATFEEKWNPFIVESAYDHQAVDQVFTPICQLNLRNELVPYGGNITAEETDDGGVLYTVTINEGMKFTDGEPVTIDDYIYGIYVRSDPSYAGRPGSTLGGFIEGVPEYFYDNANYSDDIAALEEEVAKRYDPANVTFEDFLEYAKATNLDGWWDGDPESGEDWPGYIDGEGFGEDLAAIDATNADQLFELLAKVEYENYGEYYDTLTWGSEKAKSDYALSNLSEGVDVTEISGVTRIDDLTCTVKFTTISITGDRELALNNGLGNLIPEHYYGAVTKGDVSSIIANMEPMGSGPYKWAGFADNIITCTANDEFFMAAPKIGTVRWQYIPQPDIVTSLASGAIDIANPSSSKANVEELTALGLEFALIDNAGYGYMAMNTERVPLEVRKGYFSLMNRAPTVEGYYGPDLAQVIERPMTTTLAEYPIDATAYYTYSRDEALKYFEQAGYTQDASGKLVDATGKQLVLNTYIGGSGEGDHPAYAMLVQAAEDMAALGGELQIQDVEFGVLQGAMNDGTADAWIMAWGSVYDCDKSTQFHSTGGQNRYNFSNQKMDDLLDEIVQTIDLEERRALVAEMLDFAMDQCLEMPIYQRKNMLAYNSTTVDMNTIPEASASYDYNQVLWQVDLLG